MTIRLDGKVKKVERVAAADGPRPDSLVAQLFEAWGERTIVELAAAAGVAPVTVYSARRRGFCSSSVLDKLCKAAGLGLRRVK